MLNWAEVPQKYIVKNPEYELNPICPKCSSRNSFPLMNMPGSIRFCSICKYNNIKPRIIGYTETLVEK